MNKTFAISVIALVAIIMVMGTVSAAMAVPPVQSGKVLPHNSTGETHVKGFPDIYTLPNGNEGKLWFIDIVSDNVHDHSSPGPNGEPTFCLKPKN